MDKRVSTFKLELGQRQRIGFGVYVVHTKDTDKHELRMPNFFVSVLYDLHWFLLVRDKPKVVYQDAKDA